LCIKPFTVATNKHIAELIIKHRRKTLSENEKEELEAWCYYSEENQLLFDRLCGPGYDNMVELYNRLSTTENDVRGRQQFFQHKKRVIVAMVYAAIIICMLCAGVAVYSVVSKEQDRNKNNVLAHAMPTDVINNTQVPDVHRVQLKLASGDVVYLDSSVNGHVALQYRSVIFKRDDMIRYEWSTGDAQPELEYNTLTTPPARRFSLELPDGSKAWLNASSSITYPTAFIGKERIVQVTGEVYFEVNPYPGTLGRQEKKPFIVYVNSLPGSMGVGAKVEVLGTHFNVNAYNDESSIRTTLLEGAVQFSSGLKKCLLKPGQQSELDRNGQINVIEDVDVDGVLAWKNGLLHFEDVDIESVMRRLSRWYDVDIVYRNKTRDHFFVELPAQSKLSDVLKMMELTGRVSFEIQGKKVIVN